MIQIAQARAAADLLAKKAERAGYETDVSPDEDFPETTLWVNLSRVDLVGPREEKVETRWIVEYVAPSDGSRWSIDVVEYRRSGEFSRDTEEASDEDALLAALAEQS